MTSFFRKIIETNELERYVYAEPYAGGAGTAINLLIEEQIAGIKINDAAIGIYSFWNALVHDGARFLDTFDATAVTLEEWQKQRKVFKTATEPGFELGFATFFLSRTNRSGILNAGPIGGQDAHAQKSAGYKIDCRFNKPVLRARLEKIIGLADRIEVTNLDALEFLRKLPQNTLAYLDPPYYEQGKALYLNYYKHDDHQALAEYLANDAQFPWVLSYDNIGAIRAFYDAYPLYTFNLSYTAQDRKTGSELLTHSPLLTLPEPLEIKRQRNRVVIERIVVAG